MRGHKFTPLDSKTIGLEAKLSASLTLASSRRPKAFSKFPRSLRTQYRSCKIRNKSNYSPLSNHRNIAHNKSSVFIQ